MVNRLLGFLVLFFACVSLVRADSFSMGVSSHAGLRRDTAAQIDFALHELGAQSLRDELYWTVLASNEGVLGLGQRAQGVLERLSGLSQGNKCLLLLLGYGHPKWVDGLPDDDAERRAFVAYASFAAGAYQGRLCAIEIWNEWNIGAGRIGERKRYGSSSDYVKLVADVVPVLRKIRPDVPLIVGALSDKDLDWLSEVLRGLSLLDVEVDGVSVHPYVFGDKKRNPKAVEEWIKLLDERVLDSYQRRLPVYVTEIGWPNFDGNGGVDYDTSARYLVETYVRLRSLDSVVGVWWYGLKDKGVDRGEKENGFGLMTYSGELKPAGIAFGQLARFWTGCDYVGKGRSAREYVYECKDGLRRIFLDLSYEFIHSGLLGRGNCSIVDLVGGELMNYSAGVPSSWLGRHVGVYGACAAPEVTQ